MFHPGYLHALLTRAIICRDFLLWIDVNEWINNECAECVLQWCILT
jgi:hypothetical protein